MSLNLRILLSAVILFSGGASREQEVAELYRAQWKQGAYGEAVRTLEEWLGEDIEYSPLGYRLDYVDLLFAVGRVDDAISIMEPIAFRYASPAYILRLGLLYRYRGRVQDYEEALAAAALQGQILSMYRAGREEWLPWRVLWI